jgi:hypothetical protein
MTRLLVFTVLFLGGIARGQVLTAAAQESTHAIGHKQPSEQQLPSDREDVWKGERKFFQYLQEKNLKGFMSLWDDNFVGWPDYSDHPMRKREIEAGTVEEFQSGQTPGRPLPSPIQSEIRSADLEGLLCGVSRSDRSWGRSSG